MSNWNLKLRAKHHLLDIWAAITKYMKTKQYTQFMRRRNQSGKKS